MAGVIVPDSRSGEAETSVSAITGVTPTRTRSETAAGASLCSARTTADSVGANVVLQVLRLHRQDVDEARVVLGRLEQGGRRHGGLPLFGALEELREGEKVRLAVRHGVLGGKGGLSLQAQVRCPPPVPSGSIIPVIQ